MSKPLGGVDGFPWSLPAPFAQKLKEKGGSVSFNAPTTIGIDMALVDASIGMAIDNSRNESIKQKLQRLLDSGTKAQRLDFVLGEGTYHFPEDVELLAEREPKPPFCYRFCEVTYYVVCSFTDKGDQLCREIARNICTVDCN